MRIFSGLGVLPLIFVACVGDSPTVDAGGDASQGDAAADVAADNAIVDSTTPCDATSCGGSCVDLTTSAAHCGACGHSCGGGTCVASQCEPETFQTGINAAHLGVDSTGVYYSTDALIEKCALDTCKPAPTQLWDNGVNQAIDGVAVSSGNLYFLGENNNGKPAMYRCPGSGCTVPTQLAGIAANGYAGPFVSGSDVYFAPISSGTNIQHSNCTTACTSTEVLSATTFSGDTFLVADGTSIFFYRTNTNEIYKCLASGAATCTLTTPFVAATGLTTGAIGMGIVGTTLYIAIQGASGYTNGKIVVCPTNGASCNPSTFIDKLGFPQRFAVDANGLYWWAQDETAVKSCPISGCVNGQHTVAKNITGATGDLTAQSGALYWLNYGGTQNTTTITRVVY